MHKGPVNLSNIYDTLTNPTYDEITFDNGSAEEISRPQESLANISGNKEEKRAVEK